MPKLPRISGKRIAAALKRGGFVWQRTDGNHASYLHPETNHLAVVPIAHKTVKPGTLANILQQAGLTTEEFVALTTSKRKARRTQ